MFYISVLADFQVTECSKILFNFIQFLDTLLLKVERFDKDLDL